MSSFASVCVLSYERPELLHACLESLRDGRADFELIVHDDGSKDPRVRQLLWDLQGKGGISHLLLQAPGQNEGVGEAVRKCFAVAQGDLLIKVDQDLVFAPGWLRDTRRILEDAAVGAVGSFAYHHDPVDVEKTTLDQCDGYFTVEDFVGSSFAIPRHVYENPKVGPIEHHSPAFSEDVGLKDRIRKVGYELALPDDNLAVNVGFGLGPSTVNVSQRDDGTVETRAINDGPLVFDGNWS
jgi:glycosyltransferase involved in cell wall biosynthesis